MRTRYAVKCSCGHVGNIKLSENDQPYSELWESYSLEGLDGSICSNPQGAADILGRSIIKCPKCQSTLTAENLSV